MDAATRTQVILAAVTSIPPDTEGDWSTQVHLRAAQIAAMVSDSSSVARVVDGVGNAKVFTGEVVSVHKEASSTRGVVVLNTGTDRAHDGLPAGHEQVRTDRTDSPVGMAMARMVRGLVGRRVVLWVELEGSGDRKFRVLRHVEPIDAKPAAA